MDRQTNASEYVIQLSSFISGIQPRAQLIKIVWREPICETVLHTCYAASSRITDLVAYLVSSVRLFVCLVRAPNARKNMACKKLRKRCRGQEWQVCHFFGKRRKTRALMDVRNHVKNVAYLTHAFTWDWWSPALASLRPLYTIYRSSADRRLHRYRHKAWRRLCLFFVQPHLKHSQQYFNIRHTFAIVLKVKIRMQMFCVTSRPNHVLSFCV